MPVKDKNNSLRLMLENKSTEELEELLALDFAEQEGDEPNVEYIMTVMEVIHERTKNIEEDRAKTEEAWYAFQQTIHEQEPEQTPAAGTTEKPILDQSFKTENSQTPRKHTRIVRYAIAVAAAFALLCGSAYALNFNIFQAIAEWTEETFGFVIGNDVDYPENADPFLNLRLEIGVWTDTCVAPKLYPQGAVQVGDIEIEERKNRVIIRGAYQTDNGEFTVQVIVYDTIPEEYVGTYQKDADSVQIYEAAGIIHYIMQNNENICAMWTNECVEVYIQGELTVEEIERMIDSIYEE